MKAIWNNEIIAESNQTIVVEGNHYFPPESIHNDFFESSEKHSTCPWKGEASYKSLSVNGESNPNAAWYYPDPKPAAAKIQGYYAFWKGVNILE
ncbi:MAG: DUF427 domain-containing protein [Flavobacteriaceae bacterium]|nr:DUF427 domain-containing protein [Flavobacteriaceae bacterium]